MKHCSTCLLILFFLCSFISCSKKDELRPAPKAIFIWANAGEGTVQFTDQSTEGNTYKWDFGDGSAATTDKSPRHTFARNGKYNITLTVTNPTASDKTTKEIEISSFLAPTANFTVTLGEDGQTSFTNASTNGETYVWDFGNGIISNAASPTTRYTENKKYTVSLTISGKGGEAKLSKEIEIISIKPLVDFSYSGSNGEITFVNRSKNADTYSWDFGNGKSSTEVSPTARYTKTGSYAVKLTAKGRAGESTKTINVSVVSVMLTMADVVDDQKWPDYLAGTWGVYVKGDGNKFDNYTYSFSKANNTVVYKNYYSPYVYISADPETTTISYKYSIVDNLIYTEDSYGKQSKFARLQPMSEDEMKVFRIMETSSSYTELTPYLFTRTSNEEKPVSSVIKPAVLSNVITGIWDQGSYSIYTNVFFDFSAGRNYYQYNYTFNEAKNVRKVEFKIDNNNVLSYRYWNSDFDPSWKKYRAELINNATLKLYPINANGVASSQADYTLKKR